MKKEITNNRADNKNDSRECAELIRHVKQNAQLYTCVSIAMQSYVDGMKAVLRCSEQVQNSTPTS